MISDLIAQGCLSVVIQINDGRIYMAMAKYIEPACRILKIEGMSHAPITGPVDTDGPLPSPQGTTAVISAMGMRGWMAQTVRMDAACACSHITQDSVAPTEPATEVVRTVYAYRQQSIAYALLHSCPDL